MLKRNKPSRKATSRMVLVPRDAGNDNKAYRLSKKHGVIINKGLHNVGNTCYMNASLQCLARIPYFNEVLSQYPIESATLRRTDKDSSVSLKISLPATKSPVTAEYLELISNMRSEVHSGHVSSTLNPSRLRESVLRRYPRFGGFGQQDSHELLRALLDCLKQEELVRWKRGILDKMGIQGSDVSDADRELVRLWGRAAGLATMVDRFFGGVLVNSLQCCGCGTFRTGFEPFLDLSLPMPEGEVLCNGKPRASAVLGKSKQELKRERRKKFPKSRREHRRRIRQEQMEPEDSPEDCQRRRAVDAQPEGGWDDTTEDVGGCLHTRGQELVEPEAVVVEDSADSFLVYGLAESAGPSPRLLDHPLDRPSSGGTAVVVVENCPADANSSESFARSDCPDQHPGCLPREDDGPLLCQAGTATTANPPTQAPLVSRNSWLSLSESSTSNGCCADVEDSDESEKPATATEQQQGRSSATGHPTGDTDRTPTAGEETAVDRQFSHLSLSTTDDNGGTCPGRFGADDVSQAVQLSQVPIATPSAGRGEGVTLYTCLSRFTAPERLSGQNRIACVTCTRRWRQEMGQPVESASDAGDSDPGPGRTVDLKTMVFQDFIRRDLILHPPPILTIHLKRFQQRMLSLQKSQKQISFPVMLDLSPFCSVLSLNAAGSLRYRLHGVVEHLGRLADGHYVAYVPVVARRPSTPPAPDRAALLRLVTQLTGRPLDEPPKWPWTVHDLVRRLRRCDHDLLVSAYLPPTQVEEQEEPTVVSRDLPATGDSGGDPALQDDRTWCRCSDSHVEQVPLSTVLRCQAFMLFYARVPPSSQ